MRVAFPGFWKHDVVSRKAWKYGMWRDVAKYVAIEFNEADQNEAMHWISLGISILGGKKTLNPPNCLTQLSHAL